MNKQIKDKKERSIVAACGKRIRRLREQNGMTREQLAELLGCSEVSIGRIELGQQMVKLWRLKLLCNYFNVSSDYFLQEEEPSEQSVVPSYLVKLFRDADEVEYTILSEQMLSAGRLIDYIRTVENRLREGKLPGR